jgi:sugar phosphate isomerase/epimerase
MFESNAVRQTMKLELFKTLWGHTGNLQSAIREALYAGFQGLEGPAPADRQELAFWKDLIPASGLAYIAEITTAGSYVPDPRATLEDHLRSLEEKLERSLALQPRFISCLGGRDAWPESQSVEFFGRAMELAAQAGVVISFETHRSRSTFNPWTTRRLVEQLPELKLTCDYSHWCVVCERLLDGEEDTLAVLARHAHHIHARVGYDQGPQVPHPGAPEYADALDAHQRWWEEIWRAQRERGYTTTTMTPEFGPDGYLHLLPFTGAPVADLWELNQWMATEERRHYRLFAQADDRVA